jgi:phenylalanyl-tRNA synthetase beta chain
MVNAIFDVLDISIAEEKGDEVVLTIPTYRGDVTREADVIEEVLRIYGFNAVPIPDKFNMNLVVDENKIKENAKNKIADYLVNNGCFEMMNNSLTKSEYVEKNGGDVMTVEGNVEMLNPLSQELNVMRQSLIFQGLETVAYNQNRQHPNVKLFEFGKIYKRTESGYFENNRLLIVLSGKRESEQWNVRPEENSFYTMKGLVTGLIEKLGFSDFLKEKSLKKSLLVDGVNLFLLKKNVGAIGWVARSLRKEFGIKNDVFIADLDWDALTSALNLNKVKFKELPKTFEVRRDFSLLLNEEVAFGEINEIARNAERKLLQDVKLFDVYEGERLPEGKKSYAVSFHFQDPLETLKDKQVDKIMDKIQHQLESKLNAELRS